MSTAYVTHRRYADHTLRGHPENAGRLLEKLPGSKIIGEVVKQAGEARVIID